MGANPSISGLTNRTINEDTAPASASWSFTVSDEETSADDLTVEVVSSSDTGLIPTANITLGGSGGTRTVTVDTTANDNGSSVIKLRVTDDDDDKSTSEFTVTVTPVNDAPTITGGGVASVDDNVADGVLVLDPDSSPITIGDVDDGEPGAPATETVTVTVSIPEADQDLGNLLELEESGVAGVTVVSSTVSELVVSGRPGDLTTFLQGQVRFTPIENFVPVGPSADTLNLDVRAADGGEDSAAAATKDVDIGINGINDPPTASVSAAPATAYEGVAVAPFGNFIVDDLDPGESIKVTVSLDDTTSMAGALRLPDPPGSGTVLDGGAVAITGSVGEVEAYVRTVEFVPASGTAKFNLAAQDGQDRESDMETVTVTTSISILSVNVPPEIAGITTRLLRTDEGEPIALFPNVAISDSDNDPVDVTIVVPEDWGTLTAISGAEEFTDGSGEYTLDDVTAAGATSALRNLQFTPSSTVGGQAFNFRLVVTDPGLASATDNRTRVEVIDVDGSPALGGLPGLVGNSPANPAAIQPSSRINPFGAAIVSDDGAQLRMVVALDDPEKGTLSNGGIPISVLEESDDGKMKLQVVSALGTSVEGLAEGDLVRLSGDKGVPSYNGVHEVESVDVDELTFLTTTDFTTAPSGTTAHCVWTRVYAVSGYADGGAGDTVVTAPGHGLQTGSYVAIHDTTDSSRSGMIYDGSYEVTVLDADRFTIPAPFDVDPDEPGYFAPTFGVEGDDLVFLGPADAAGLALRGLRYEVDPEYVFPPESPGGTTFRIRISDGSTTPTIVEYSIVLQSNRRNLLVTMGGDLGLPGDLRSILHAAEENDTVTFALEDYPTTIRLEAPLVIRKNLTIKGPGADNLILSGDSDGDQAPDVNILDVARATVIVEGLTFSHGLAGEGGTGGAIAVGRGGVLGMESCVVRDSEAALWGGGIDVDGGSLTLANSLIVGNSTSPVLGLGGGGVSLFTSEPCTIINTTFSGNVQASPTGFGGGALYVENETPETQLPITITHSTFARNRDAAGGGTSIQSNVFGTSVRLLNSIVADGLGGNLEVAGAGEIESLGGNLSDDLTRAVLTQGGVPQAVFLFDHPTDKTQIDPGLSPLARTVGPSATHALSAASPAIDGAQSMVVGVDQRGVVRSDGLPDCGAHEFGSTQRVVVNEIRFGSTAGDFLELYVPRNSEPVDFKGYEVWVDGERRYTVPGFSEGLRTHGIRISGETIDNTTEAEAILTEVLAELGESTGTTSGGFTVEQNGSAQQARTDWGGAANEFSSTLPYPGGIASNGSAVDFLVAASWSVNLPAGDYTVFTESDDGFTLEMTDAAGVPIPFSMKYGAGLTQGEDNELRFENPTGNSRTGGQFTLAEPTVVAFYGLFWERGGGDYWEIGITDSHTEEEFPGPFSIFEDGAVLENGTELEFGTEARLGRSRVNPGFGVIVADSAIDGDGTDVLVVPFPGLGLTERSTVELRPPSGLLLGPVAYNGAFADPADSSSDYMFLATESITLDPQFEGFAFLPHGEVSTDDNSPGRDSNGTIFGGNNAAPGAVPDNYLVREDEATTLDVLGNDSDADGADRLVIVDLSGSDSESRTGMSDASALSLRMASVVIDPANNGTMGTPHRGLQLVYDPRLSAEIQALPVGAELADDFLYTILDLTTGVVAGLRDGGASTTIVESAAHRLTTGVKIAISGTGESTYDKTHTVTAIDEDAFSIPVAFVPGVSDGTWEAVEPRPIGDGPNDTQRSTAEVALTILGANDPPTPADDLVTSGSALVVDEETVVRIMGDKELAGGSTMFDTDPWYPHPRIIANQSLLTNDTDPDSDDHGDVEIDVDGESLDLVGVFTSVHPIASFAQAPGLGAVSVTTAADHGLEDGDTILLANYRGHPSYNDVFTVEVVDADTFTISTDFIDDSTTVIRQVSGDAETDVFSASGHGLASGDAVRLTFVDGFDGLVAGALYYVTEVATDSFQLAATAADAAAGDEIDFVGGGADAVVTRAGNGLWVPYDPAGNLTASSRRGGEVTLEIRADHSETNIVYNPRPSEFLDGIAEGYSESDCFYYAVEDSHGAMGIAKVAIEVEGVNDDPVPGADPGSLAVFDPLLDERLDDDDATYDERRMELAELLAELMVEFLSPASDGSRNRALATVSVLGEPDAGLFRLDGIPLTDEESPLDFDIDPSGSGDLLANDLDVDRGDVLTVGTPGMTYTSREGATVTVSEDGLNLEYDPSESLSLEALARGEWIIDTFEVTINDSVGNGVKSLVAILVVGLNDTPLPQPDAYTAKEDELLRIGPPGVLLNDVEPDQSGRLPDDRRILVPLHDAPTTVIGARYSTSVVSVGTDVRAGSISGFAPDSQSAGLTVVDAPGHMLAIGDEILIDGTGIPSYDESFSVVASDPEAGTFSIGIPFVGGSESQSGTWSAPDTEAGRVTGFSAEGASLTVVNAPGHVLAPGEEVVIRGTGVSEYDRQFVIFASDREAGTFTIQVGFIEGSSLAAGSWSAVRSTLDYDPRGSLFDLANPTVFTLDGLGVGQEYLDEIQYTVFDGSFVFAMDDLFKVAADTAGAELEVLANDRNLTGVTSGIFLVAVGPTSAGGTAELATNSDGLQVISYVPEPNFVGDELIRYEVEDEWGNRDSGQVTARVTVNQLNGNLQANADFFTVALGQEPSLDVLANDNIIPAGVGSLEITAITQQPQLQGTGAARGSATIEPDGTIRFVPENAADGEAITIKYEISGGGTSRAEAVVTIRIEQRGGALFMREDSFSVPAGSEDVPLDVTANDNILPGNGLPLSVEIFGQPDNGTVKLNDDGNGFLYTPDAGFVGTDRFGYVARDGYGGTGLSGVTITVGSLVTNCDFFVVKDDVVDEVLPVLANDRVLNSASGEVSLLNLRATPDGEGKLALELKTADAPATDLGKVRLHGTEILFDASGDPGEATFYYTIVDQLNGREAIGEVTLVVVASGINANPDFYSVLVDSESADLDVLSNDLAIPEKPLVIVSTGAGVDAPDQGGSVEIVETDDGPRIRYQPAAGFVGEETFTYTITDAIGTDTAKVVVTVGRGDLFANKDAFAVFYEVAEENDEMTTDDDEMVSFSLPVLVNDRVLPDNGEELVITGVGIDDNTDPNAPSEDGTVEVAEDGTSLHYTPAAGAKFPAPPRNYFIEKFTYVVSDGTTRRAEGQVVVKVWSRGGLLGAGGGMEVKDDAFTVQSESNANVLDVLANDGVKPAPVTGWTITEVSDPQLFPVDPDPADEIDGGVVSIAGGTILYSPRAGFVGTVRFSYKVSDGLGGTGMADVTVKVGITRLCEDRFVVLSDSADNEFDLLANDGILPGEDARSEFTLGSAPIVPEFGTVRVEEGRVLYSPAADFVGTDRFVYTVRDGSGGTISGVATIEVEPVDSDRAAATVEVTVKGVNDAPRIDTSGAIPMVISDKSQGEPFLGVLLIEVDEQGQQIVKVVVAIDDPESGYFINLGGFVEIGSGVYEFVGTAAEATLALQGLVFVPMENWVTVTEPPVAEQFGFSLSIMDFDSNVPDPLTTTDTSLSIGVYGVNDPPVIKGAVSGQSVYYRGSINAFAGVVVTEVDDHTLQPLTVQVILDEPTHGILASPSGSFVGLGGGVYQFVGTAAEVTAAFGELLFVPTTGDRLQAGLNPADSETTRFTIVVDDGFENGRVTDDNTTVTAIHGYVAEVAALDADMNDNMGWSVGASSDFVVAGAPNEDENGNGAGAVYVFAPTGPDKDEWRQAEKVLASDGSGGDRFGFSVDIDGEFFVAGAPRKRTGPRDTGAAYVFARQGDSWIEVAQLLPPDGASGDDFGFSVGISGDVIVVGSPRADTGGTSTGSAYVFARQGGDWVFQTRLAAPVVRSGDQFGYSVDVSGSTIISGAPYHSPSGVQRGSAVVFERDSATSATWSQVVELVPTDMIKNTTFGWSVGIDDDTAVIGAPLHDENGTKTGAAYVFQRDGDWEEVAKLLPPDGENTDEFGVSVDVSDDEVVVGMHNDGDAELNQSKFGSSYIFSRNEDGADRWGLIESVDSLSPDNNDELGLSVAIGGHTAAFGIPFDDAGGIDDAGGLIIYRLKYNNAPNVRVPIPDQVAEVARPFLFTVPASAFGDPDVWEVLTYEATLEGGSLPSWLELDQVSGTFSGTPGTGDEGRYMINVSVVDEDGLMAESSFHIDVVSLEKIATKRVFSLLEVLQPSYAVEAHGLTANGDDSRFMVIRYVGLTERANVDRLRYVVEVSEDLAEWRPATGNLSDGPPAGQPGLQEYIWTAIRPLSVARTQFYRVRIQRGEEDDSGGKAP